MGKKNAALANEVAEERLGYDLVSRLASRPKRKPIVVKLFLDEAAGEELGYARDIENEFGVSVGRAREGVLGELDAEKSKDEPDQKVIERLTGKAKELIKRINDSRMEITLQWIPQIAEEVLAYDTKLAIGLKRSQPVPENRLNDFRNEWLAQAIVACVLKFEDLGEGVVLDKISLQAARILREQLPKSETPKLDKALNSLLNRAAISTEALDNADFSQGI